MKRKWKTKTGAILCTMLCTMMCMVLAGCTQKVKEAEAEVATEETAAEETQTVTMADSAVDSDIVVDMKDVSKGVTNDENVEVLIVKAILPVVSIGGNSEASKKINAFYEDGMTELDKTIEEYTGYANEEYEFRKEDDSSFYPYEIQIERELARADSAIISIASIHYEFIGGAHGNSTKIGDSFNPETGERLAFADIVEDENAAKEFVLSYLTKEMETQEYQDMLFEDAQTSAKTVLEADNWYFSQEGVVFVAEHYLIAPYAAGILEFTIPYKEFAGLKEVYK